MSLAILRDLISKKLIIIIIGDADFTAAIRDKILTFPLMEGLFCITTVKYFPGYPGIGSPYHVTDDAAYA